MVLIETISPLENFRKFIIFSTYRSIISITYENNPYTFPERQTEHGDIYIEAIEKFSAKKLKIAFVKARETPTLIYVSKTVGPISKWRQIRKNSVKDKDDAFNNALINLLVSKFYQKHGLSNIVFLKTDLRDR